MRNDKGRGDTCYGRFKSAKIVFLSPDINVPSVAVLFANYVPDEICSLGAILDNTDISADMILKNIVTVKTMKDFGCLGFKSGESKFSYPTPTDDIVAILNDLKRRHEHKIRTLLVGIKPFFGKNVRLFFCPVNT